MIFIQIHSPLSEWNHPKKSRTSRYTARSGSRWRPPGLGAPNTKIIIDKSCVLLENMSSNTSNLPPNDPKVIREIVDKLKKQGLFDKFRKDCLADVDTKVGRPVAVVIL